MPRCSTAKAIQRNRNSAGDLSVIEEPNNMKITKRLLIWLARQFDFFTDGFSVVQPRVRLWERSQSSSAEKSPEVNRQDAFLRLVNDARSRIIEITPMELAKKRLRPLIIDVREEKEFLTGHIGGAKHISRGLLEERIGQVASDLTTQIVVYCTRGHRGALAADCLRKMGYQNVYSLKGGLQHWFEAGGMVERTPN
jgi:rhodanese-related sulfurtransferase